MRKYHITTEFHSVVTRLLPFLMSLWVIRFTQWRSKTCGWPLPWFASSTVLQQAAESRPEKCSLEQQERFHHPVTQLLLHRPLPLRGRHWRSQAQLACVLCTQNRSVFATLFSKHINVPKVGSLNYSVFFPHWSQWVTSQRFTWTPADLCRHWRGRGWLWTALPLQSWTPESTSPGTILERSELPSAGIKRETIELWLGRTRNCNPPS